MNLNQIGGIPFAENLWKGNHILGWFFLFSIFVVLLSWINVKFIRILAIKFKWSPIFVGGIVLSLFTSLPEFVTGLYGGVEDISNMHPSGAIYTLFNATGANALQVFIIAIFGIFLLFWWFTKNYKDKFLLKVNNNNNFHFFLKNKLFTFGNENQSQIKLLSKIQVKSDSDKVFKQKISLFFYPIWTSVLKSNFILWLITFIQYIIMIIAIYIPQFGQAFNVNGFSFINFLFFLSWFFLAIYTFKFDKKSGDNLYSPDLDKFFDWKLNNYFLLIITFLTISLFSLVAYLNSGIVDKLTIVYNIPQNTGAGFILSVITSLPEITLFLTLVYKRMFITAVSGILGSSVFNLSIAFWSNILSLKPIYGNYIEKMKSQFVEANQIGPWLILSLILYGLISLSSIKKVAQKPLVSVFFCLLIFIGYISGFVIISSIGIKK